MRVLILGGTGLISTGITHQLLQRGHAVRHYNRGMSKPDMPLDVESVVGQRADAVGMAQAAEGCDAVIDMVCYTAEDARATAAAFSSRPLRYLMCSTVDVFGKSSATFPITERSPRDPDPAFTYATDKAECEVVLEDLSARSELALTILRPAATYLNTAVSPVGSFALAMERLRAGAPFILHGDGSSIWSSCHRDDVASAFVEALTCPQAIGRSYNLAGQEWMTWKTYWAAVASAIGCVPKFLYIPTATLSALDPDLAEGCLQNFQFNSIYCIDAASRDLDFASRTDWATGIARNLDLEAMSPASEVERRRYDTIVDRWLNATRLALDDRP